jgi:hypothetical protein
MANDMPPVQPENKEGATGISEGVLPPFAEIHDAVQKTSDAQDVQTDSEKAKKKHIFILALVLVCIIICGGMIYLRGFANKKSGISTSSGTSTLKSYVSQLNHVVQPETSASSRLKSLGK